jgi:hypothetical protein
MNLNLLMWYDRFYCLDVKLKYFTCFTQILETASENLIHEVDI